MVGAADLEIEETSLQLASAVDGVRPNGVKTQKKKARTDGDLPLGADAEVPKSEVPCGSGGDVGIAIVAPPLSLAHDVGVVTLGPHGHGVSNEHQRRILAIRGGRQHRTEYCGAHLACYPKKGLKTWWSSRSNLRADLEAWDSVPFDAHLGWRSQPERSTRQSLGLLAAWLACAVFSKDADEHASAVPFLCFGERVEHRNALVAQPSGADLAMLEPALREGESLESQTSA